MATKKKLQPVLWYSLAPPKLSEDVPNIKPGDMLQLTRKRSIRKTKDIALQKNGKWRSWNKTFPKGTMMTYLGEFRIENPHCLEPELVPYILVSVWGEEADEKYFFHPCELKSLKKFRKEVKDEQNGNRRSSDNQ